VQKTNAKDARQDYRHQATDYFLVIDRRTGEVIGRLLDISLAGFKMVTDVPLAVNMPLECQLSLPQALGNIRELPFEGTVRWCVHNTEMDCYEIGCQLHEVTEKFQALLAKVLLEFEGK
jgi:hypothetical protein